MGGILAGGVELFLGVTGSGKTTLAKKRQAEESARWKMPSVTMDLESAADWQDVPHAESVKEVLESLYVRRVSPRVWTPKTESERTLFFNTVAHWGGASILIDGLPMIFDAHNLDEQFRQALYRHRHGRLRLPVYWLLVAQRASLIHRHVFAACRMVYVFRQAPGTDADRIFHEFDIPPDVSTKLERGKHEPITLGFPEGGNATGSSTGAGVTSSAPRNPPSGAQTL